MTSAKRCWCARCKYSFEAMTPPECPMCGTQDVERARDPDDEDEQDDGDGEA